MLFFYSARNQDNELVRGTIEAISTQAAREALRDMDLQAEELHEATMREKEAIASGKHILPHSFHTPNLVLEGEEKALPKPPAPPPSTVHRKEEHPEKKKKKQYYPFTDTLRLYAGWLLAWYSLVYILGSYQHIRSLPFRIPYVEALLPPFSPIVLTFTLATFLFLLCTSVQRTVGKGKLTGVACSILGVGIFVWYRLNV
ncbi:hypothetical protein COU76_02340 [Candidatus Peregrinibacteria bacterium CG10_big_fil_rev_8_21_14_0_10_49_10]|nr:MAG: hypothetical protein COU76_02340 [Candidatus Peregrinibacteria bacterium CG10_big_fil_rev_8_21_14_0_10_49_10]